MQDILQITDFTHTKVQYIYTYYTISPKYQHFIAAFYIMRLSWISTSNTE